MQSAGGRLEVESVLCVAFGVNCYLLTDGDDTVVVDPGDDACLARLTGRKVSLVVNTHGHADHIAGNAAVCKRTGASIAVGAADAFMLTDPEANLSVPFGGFVKSPPASVLLSEGDVVSVGRRPLSVIELPGHSPGGIGLLGEGYLLVGDTLFADSIGRTDFPSSDHEAMERSLRRIMELDDDLIVLPGHGPSGRLGELKRTNPWLVSLADA